MNRFAKHLKNERGVSLVEVLGTMLIATIVMLSIYSVFTIALKTYTKITIEGRVRDEADYIVSMIMNNLYSSDYDDVQYNEQTKSLEFYERQDVAFKKDALTYSYTNTPTPAARLYIEDGAIIFEKNDGTKTAVSSFQEEGTSPVLEEGSSIGVVCTEEGSITYKNDDSIQSLDVCKSGVVKLDFLFKIEESDKSFAITSEVGF